MSISICSLEAEVFATSSTKYLWSKRWAEDLKEKDLTAILMYLREVQITKKKTTTTSKRAFCHLRSVEMALTCLFF